MGSFARGRLSTRSRSPSSSRCDAPARVACTFSQSLKSARATTTTTTTTTAREDVFEPTKT